MNNVGHSKESTLAIIQYLLRVLPFACEQVVLKDKNNILIVKISREWLTFFVEFIKNHQMFQFKTLIGITAVDYPQNAERFEVNYFLLSYKLNMRIIIKVTTTDLIPLDSISKIFKGAVWYEREVWDMFGVFFLGHPDLRRILTDYGFEGFPFRKDFPQTGFLEVRYDDEKKHVIYESVSLDQEFRAFDFSTPWLNVK